MNDSIQHLAWLQTRRSTREFTTQTIERATLERLLQAAITAPSNTNRQPWRFAVVTSSTTRLKIAEAIASRATEMRNIINQSHHADAYANYGDFFHEPIANAQAIIIPQYRDYPDLIANLIESGGGDPSLFHTSSAMQAELCSTCGAIMALLTQAHAEGLGACWMAGPMIARDQIHDILHIKSPYQMIGGIALGYPLSTPTKKPRKPLNHIAQWF